MLSYQILLSTLAVLGMTVARPLESRQSDDAFPYPQVRFTNTFGQQWCAGEEYTLSWTGGDGHYQLIKLEKYPQIPVPHPGHLIDNSTQTSYVWTAPSVTEVPANSSFYFSIEDANHPIDGSKWYDNSVELPLIACH